MAARSSRKKHLRSPTRPVNYRQAGAHVPKAREAVHVAIDGLGLERTIRHLVQLRASQINDGGYCVKIHTREAREWADG